MSTLRRRIMGAIKPEEDYSMYAVHKKVNPEVMAVCYAQGWAANEDYMTFEEAAAVTDIGTAFRGNLSTHFDELKYFTGLTSIANLAFASAKFESITIPENIQSIGINGILYLVPIKVLTWNTGYTKPDQWNLRTIGGTFVEYKSDNPIYSVKDGCLLSADGLTLYAVPFYKSYTFPSGVVNVGRTAFAMNKGTSLFVSPAYNYIDNAYLTFCQSSFRVIDLRNATINVVQSTFQGCKATTIILPSNCNDFRGNTFYNASNLTSLVLYSTTPPSSVGAITYILNNTPITNGTGYVYVPDASVDAYKADSKWSAIENQIKPISEYNGGYQL